MISRSFGFFSQSHSPMSRIRQIQRFIFFCLFIWVTRQDQNRTRCSQWDGDCLDCTLNRCHFCQVPGTDGFLSQCLEFQELCPGPRDARIFQHCPCLTKQNNACWNCTSFDWCLFCWEFQYCIPAPPSPTCRQPTRFCTDAKK